jgi:hypothetical protein
MILNVNSDMLARGLQRLGIIGLVDEATGFQATRDREALQEMLDRFLRHELAAWAKRFPDEFYEHIFRLRGRKWHGPGKNPPQVVASYTKDIAYARRCRSLRLPTLVSFGFKLRGCHGCSIQP